MSYQKKYPTGYQKRTLNYTSTLNKDSPLQLPQKYYSKISHAEYKKIKQAFFLMSSNDYTLTYQNFAKTIRSLGIVVKTSTIYQTFLPYKGKKMTWQMFIDSYITLRNYKGSFKQIDVAVNLLDKEYNGRWELLFKDLKQFGDVLSDRQIQIFKNQIMGQQILNNQNLKNALLGYK